MLLCGLVISKWIINGFKMVKSKIICVLNEFETSLNLTNSTTLSSLFRTPSCARSLYYLNLGIICKCFSNMGQKCLNLSKWVQYPLANPYYGLCYEPICNPLTLLFVLTLKTWHSRFSHLFSLSSLELHSLASCIARVPWLLPTSNPRRIRSSPSPRDWSGPPPLSFKLGSLQSSRSFRGPPTGRFLMRRVLKKATWVGFWDVIKREMTRIAGFGTWNQWDKAVIYCLKSKWLLPDIAKTNSTTRTKSKK